MIRKILILFIFVFAGCTNTAEKEFTDVLADSTKTMVAGDTLYIKSSAVFGRIGPDDIRIGRGDTSTNE